MEEAMRQEAAAGYAAGSGGAASGVDPSAMAAEMRAQQGLGLSGAGGQSAEEMARLQRENAPGIGVEGNNGLGAAIPGVDGPYGGRGGQGGLGGEFDENDAEYVVGTFASAVLADDYE
jgi:hypothetical protein